LAVVREFREFYQQETWNPEVADYQVHELEETALADVCQ
jgi:hypothetical protein